MTSTSDQHVLCARSPAPRRWILLLIVFGLLTGVLQGRPLAPEKAMRVLSEADLQSLPVLGDAASEVVILEFADFECPYCRQHAATTMPHLVDKYVRTGKARYVFAHFPIEEHSNAKRLAIAAQCAQAQGKFWPLHDQLFRLQGPPTDVLLNDLAKQAGLDTDALALCLRDRKISAIIDSSKRLGDRLGVEGTPWFVIGRNVGGRWSEVSQVFGARPPEYFEGLIDKLLAGAPLRDGAPKSKELLFNTPGAITLACISSNVSVLHVLRRETSHIGHVHGPLESRAGQQCRGSGE